MVALNRAEQGVTASRGRCARAASLAVLFAAMLAGCGSSERARDGHAAAATPPIPTAVATAAPTPRRHDADHKRRTATAAVPPASGLVACDSNITVRRGTTTCGFGENVFYTFHEEALPSDPQNAFRAFSPATRREYAVACATDDAENVTCVAGDGGEVHFSLTAQRVYDDDQAARYAASHDIGLDSGSAPSSPNDDSDYVPVVPDDSSPSDEGPTYGDEIPNYDEGRGYRVQCADGMWSKSGGIQGACSGHGGVL